MLYKYVVKPLLFSMDAEKAHHFTLGSMKITSSIPGGLAILKQMYGVAEKPEMGIDLGGIHFANPVGLAAGLDKNGIAVPAFSAMGFGFAEVGTVTPRAQPGNDLPRLFRLPEDAALINRMGFNNEGATQLANRLQSYPASIPIAINIGKNKDTTNEQAAEDYRQCISTLYPYGDFFVVNISSPNTPGLRSLQHGDELQSLLHTVTTEMRVQQEKHSENKAKPVFVKIAPDLADFELEKMIELIISSGIYGVIATNTTIRRDGIKHRHAKETGGLSGKPLTETSTEIIRRIYTMSGGKLPIIGSGGIFSSEDAYGKIRAGASLIEIYTALIYHGPGLVRTLNEGLFKLMKQDGFTHISQAIGADAKVNH